MLEVPSLDIIVRPCLIVFWKKETLVDELLLMYLLLLGWSSLLQSEQLSSIAFRAPSGNKDDLNDPQIKLIQMIYRTCPLSALLLFIQAGADHGLPYIFKSFDDTWRPWR